LTIKNILMNKKDRRRKTEATFFFCPPTSNF
jgi:hypothetical protein